MMCWGVAACGGGSSSTPSAPTPPPRIRLSGRVTATGTDHAIADLAVTLNTGQAARTDGNGAFSFEFTQTDFAVNRLALDGPSIVTREVGLTPPSPREITLDAIEAQPPFDLQFYRILVRNAFESTDIQPLRRWVQSPMIYIRTVDDTDASIPSANIDLVAAVLADTVPRWTNQRLSVAGVASGTETREGQPGWLTVKWSVAEGRCGRAQIGTDGGYIELRSPFGSNCTCNGLIRTRTIRHELGHALGFWHTGTVTDLMSGLSVSLCDQLPSARELYHANIAYSRPVGNVDPDNDTPSSSRPLSSPRAARVIVD
jgi:hypothetical protein